MKFKKWWRTSPYRQAYFDGEKMAVEAFNAGLQHAVEVIDELAAHAPTTADEIRSAIRKELEP